MERSHLLPLALISLAAASFLSLKSGFPKAQGIPVADPSPPATRVSAGNATAIEPGATQGDSFGVFYRNPRVYNVDFSFEIPADAAGIDRHTDLKVWIPIPREWDSQKHVQILSVVPEPHAQFNDPEYGNRIYYWDFGKEPESPSYQVRVAFRLESYEIEAIVDTARIEPYDTTSEEYHFYTKSGHTIHVTREIQELAHIAVGDERNPYVKAQLIFGFVRERMGYGMMLGRGIDFLLSTATVDEETGEQYFRGGCDQFSALFIALSRAVGIPARSVIGFVGVAPAWTSETLSVLDTIVTEEGFAGARYRGLMAHVWAEFFLPGYGWIPVDPTWGIFGSRQNLHVIMSKGPDIPLGADAPLEHHGGYGFQWVPIFQGRVGFLQSAVWNIGKIRGARVDIYNTLDPFPAHVLADYLTIPPAARDATKELDNWKIEWLEAIDYHTRDYQDRDIQSFKLFEGETWPNWDLARAYETYVCHMLRKLMGDEKFYQLVTEYLDERARTSESIRTSRFIDLTEELHGESLAWFFEQWKLENGLPHLRLEDVRREERGESWLVRGRLIQTGRIPFTMPVPMVVRTEKGESLHTVWHAERQTDFDIELADKPIGVQIDPEHDLLLLRRMPQRLSQLWQAHPEIIVAYGTAAEERANRAIAEWFHDYLGVGPEKLRADTAVTSQDLGTEVLVLIGRPATNAVSKRFEDHFKVEFDGETFSYNGISYTKPSQGVAQIVDHPLRARGQLILYAGLSEGAMLALRDLDIQDAPHSYVLYDGATTIAAGVWEGDSDLIWRFEQ